MPFAALTASPLNPSCDQPTQSARIRLVRVRCNRSAEEESRQSPKSSSINRRANGRRAVRLPSDPSPRNVSTITRSAVSMVLLGLAARGRKKPLCGPDVHVHLVITDVRTRPGDSTRD